MEIENPASVKKAVQCGWPLSLIRRLGRDRNKSEDPATVRVRGLDIRRDLKIVYRTDKHLGRAAHAFIEMASE